MRYSSHSSCTTSPHAETFNSVTAMCSVMGPYTMSDQAAPNSTAVMGSAVGFAATFSAGASGFYGNDDAVHRYQRATRFREGPRSGRSFHQGVSSQAHLDERGGGNGCFGFSRMTLYGSPCAREAAVHDGVIAAAVLTEARFGSTHRTNSSATFGTALSDCHLSRKGGGGFTPTSGHTFLKSDDDFGRRSLTSRCSLHDSLMAPVTSMYCSIRGSVGSGCYVGTTFRDDEHVNDDVELSADGAAVHTVAPHRLSDSSQLPSRGSAASRASSENDFSVTRQIEVSEWLTTSVHPAHTQLPRQLSGLPTSQDDRLVSPRKGGSMEDGSEYISVSIISPASVSLENGFGPTGCSPFYDLGTGALESTTVSKRCSEELDGDDVAPTTIAGINSSPDVCSVRRRSAATLSMKSALTSMAPTPSSPMPPTRVGASTRSNEMACTPGSVDTSNATPVHPPKSSCCKPRRKDPRTWSHTQSTCLDAPQWDRDIDIASTLVSPPVPSTAISDVPTPAAITMPLTGDTPAAYTEDAKDCYASVACEAKELPQQQPSPARAPSSTTSNFTVSPPSYNERHPRLFLRRRHLERYVKPLSAVEMQMAMVPFSSSRDVPPNRDTSSGTAAPAPPKSAASLPPLQNDQVSVPGTVQGFSPSATASSSASFGVTPEKFITLAGGGGAGRPQHRRAGCSGFYFSLGMEAICAMTESANEKSLRSLGGRSCAELRLLGESGNGIMSRSCPSVEYSIDEGTNPFAIQRSVSCSVYSARSATDSGEISSIARKKRQTERMLSSGHDPEEEHVAMHQKSSQ
ncbi:hypothetical protein, unknown function [Leishmania tarentolae]|uniref:Uncharacterized protein n=1 Tax=Leishmania tarentolae TaxID=5689 RepID=A0A640KQ82_LEITA|nr:hypothetical protein, unknown function [Leishmania tarentolae]